MLLIVFLTTLILSYTSALPPGIINVRVMDHALFRSSKQAFFMTLGAAFAEFFYAFMAANVGEVIMTYPMMETYISFFMLVLFLILAIYYFCLRPRPLHLEYQEVKEAQQGHSNLKSMAQGLVLGVINPQMFPYWLTTYLFLKTQFVGYGYIPFFDTAFILGAVVGGWLCLMSIVGMASYHRRVLFRLFSRYNFNTVIAVLFLVLFLIQLVDIYDKN